MTTPKYSEETELYWRSRALPDNPWEPGKLCVMPSDMVQELPKGGLIDMQEVLMGIAEVEGIVASMIAETNS